MRQRTVALFFVLVALVLEAAEASAMRSDQCGTRDVRPHHAVVVESAESVPQAHLARVPGHDAPALRELPAGSPVPLAVRLIGSVIVLGSALLLVRRTRLHVVVP